MIFFATGTVLWSFIVSFCWKIVNFVRKILSIFGKIVEELLIFVEK
jgi:hypothetical protein